MTRPSPTTAVRAVADYYGLDPRDIMGARSRATHLRRPLRVVCLVLSAEFEMSQRAIANALGVSPRAVGLRLASVDAFDVADAHKVVAILDRRAAA